KLAFVFFVAHWVDRNAGQLGDLRKGLAPFAAMLAGVLVLLMLERDLGTSIVIVGIFLSAYWAGGGRFRHMGLLVAALVLAFLVVPIIEPYRFARLTNFKNQIGRA